MKNTLCSLRQTIELIDAGQTLIIAGDEKLLRQLPKGSWIGGTIPYFVAEDGGVCTAEKLFVTEVPSFVAGVGCHFYPVEEMPRIYSDAPANGFSFALIPASSRAHLQFALNASSYDKFASSLLIGWITGVNLADLGKITPKVFDGTTLTAYDDGCLVMHITLPERKSVEANIINVFEPGDGDCIMFESDSFVMQDALINGEKRDFAKYITDNAIDTRLPLVADYNGALINVSFQSVDNGRVAFYAPVFKGVEYRLAKPVGDYITQFVNQMPKITSDSVFFSCNCILNYLYCNLEGRKAGHFTGPVTFGEIAYQLLNQTLVYAEIKDV
jgi:hypothetical protein